MKESWRAMGSAFVNSFDWIDDEICHHTPRVGLWLETTGRSEDETFAELLARLDEAAV